MFGALRVPMHIEDGLMVWLYIAGVCVLAGKVWVFDRGAAVALFVALVGLPALWALVPS